MDLDGYIEGLQRGGLFHSDGAFTLDQAQALQKLREYQIAKPAEFSAGLVASAMAAGADWIRIATPANGFVLEHNGASISHDRLVTLFSTLLVSRLQEELSSVQELAYGLNALLALKPHSIRVTCSDAAEVAVLDLNSQQLVVARAEPFETYGATQRTIVRAQGLWKGLDKMMRLGLGRRPELGVLRERCKFASASIICDGEPLVCPAEYPEAVCVARLGSPPPLPFTWPDSMLEIPGELSAWVGLSPEAAPGVTMVIHGVSFELEEDGLPPGLQAVVFTTNLRKDLSRAGVVKDEAYQRCLEQLTEARGTLLEALSGNWRVIAPDQRRQTSRFLEKEARQARQRWETESADRLSATARSLSHS